MGVVIVGQWCVAGLSVLAHMHTPPRSWLTLMWAGKATTTPIFFNFYSHRKGGEPFWAFTIFPVCVALPSRFGCLELSFTILDPERFSLSSDSHVGLSLKWMEVAVCVNLVFWILLCVATLLVWWFCVHESISTLRVCCIWFLFQFRAMSFPLLQWWDRGYCFPHECGLLLSCFGHVRAKNNSKIFLLSQSCVSPFWLL